MRGLSIASTTALFGGNSGLTGRNGCSIPGGMNSSATFPAVAVPFAPPPSRPKSPTAPSCELILPETGDSAIALTRFLAAVGSLAVICAPPFTAVRTPTSSAAKLPPSTPAVTEPCQPASSYVCLDQECGALLQPLQVVIAKLLPELWRSGQLLQSCIGFPPALDQLINTEK